MCFSLNPAHPRLRSLENIEGLMHVLTKTVIQFIFLHFALLFFYCCEKLCSFAYYSI